MSHQTGAIIIGGHYQGLGALKSLGENGVPLCLIDHELHIGRFSKYAHRFYHSPSIKSEESFLVFLQNLAINENLQDWVIYPTDDETVYFLAKNKKQLEKYFNITTPMWNITKYAYNKKLTYKLAADLGIPMPKTYFPSKWEDYKKFDLSFPFIIKPAIVKKFYNIFGKKVFVVNNETELKEFYDRTVEVIPTEEILFQEYIPGGSAVQYSFCPMFKEGIVLTRIMARRLRQHPIDFGHASTFVETVNIPELEKTGSKFLKAINYYGIAEIEYMQDPRDGQYKLLEINPRLWGWHTISRKAGVNLPYHLFQDILGREIHFNGYREGIKWVRWITDIPTVVKEIFKRKMSVKDYIHSLAGEKEYAVWSFSDPLPMIMEWLLLPYFWRKKGF
jgi:predicted ATP-grasp superfamily ATP-dependent carboligase